MVTIKFDPDADIPDLSGKVIFITGGTAGLGKESAIALAKHSPERIYFCGRDGKRGAEVVREIRNLAPDVKASFIGCDLASLASVQRAAKQFVTSSSRLDILMCNAGVTALPPGLTKDGYEVQFGTHHIGHALLIKLLLPTLLQTANEPDASVRIILNTSVGSRGPPKGGIYFNNLRTPQGSLPLLGAWIRCGQSKLASILYAAELARRHPGITAVSVHAGAVTNASLVGNLCFLNRALVRMTSMGQNCVALADAVRNQVWAATARAAEVVNGAFYEPVAVLGARGEVAGDGELAAKLWEWTEKELEPYSLDGVEVGETAEGGTKTWSWPVGQGWVADL